MCDFATIPTAGALCDPEVASWERSISLNNTSCADGHTVCTCLLGGASGFHMANKYAYHCTWRKRNREVMKNQVCPEVTAKASEEMHTNDAAIYQHSTSGIVRTDGGDFLLEPDDGPNRGKEVGIVLGSILALNLALGFILGIHKQSKDRLQESSHYGNNTTNSSSNNAGDERRMDVSRAMLQASSAATVNAAATVTSQPSAATLPLNGPSPFPSPRPSVDFERSPRASMAAVDFETASYRSVEGASRGLCARCGMPVLMSHHRDKLGSGQYVHTSPNHCNALTATGDWVSKAHTKTESKIGDQISYSRDLHPAGESIMESSV